LISTASLTDWLWNSMAGAMTIAASRIKNARAIWNPSPVCGYSALLMMTCCMTAKAWSSEFPEHWGLR
jgi:hypothetical protein